jgi:hypothetical protein
MKYWILVGKTPRKTTTQTTEKGGGQYSNSYQATGLQESELNRTPSGWGTVAFFHCRCWNFGLHTHTHTCTYAHASTYLKNSIFLVKTPCSPLNVNQCFGATYRLYLQDRRTSQERNLCKAEAKCSSETPVDFQRTIRRYIPEDRNLRNHRRENLKSYKHLFIFSIKATIKGKGYEGRGLKWLRVGPRARFCKVGNEQSGFHNRQGI